MSALVGGPKRHRGTRLGERRGNRDGDSSRDASCEEGVLKLFIAQWTPKADENPAHPLYRPPSPLLSSPDRKSVV